MQQQEIQVVQGNCKYNLPFTLTDSTGAAIDFTDMDTLEINVQRPGASALKFSGDLTVDGENSAGTCHYEVQETDFDEEGKYYAEITLIYDDGETLTFPNIVIKAFPKLPRE